MTVQHLLSAVAVGLAFGVIGTQIIPAGRRLPAWVPIAAAVGAALLATITAHLADSGAAGVSTTDMIMQIIFAAVSITLVAATADRQPARHRHDGSIR